MSDKKISREENRALRLNEIMDAAESAFVAKGFRGAGIGSIAKDAGMSVGHLYHYFENKNAIVLAIIQREEERVVQILEDLEAVAPDLLTERIISTMTLFAEESMDLFRSGLSFEILAEAQRNPDVAKLVRDIDMRISARFIALLREKAGFEDAEMRATLIFITMSGLSVRFTRNPDLAGEEQIALVTSIVRRLMTETDLELPIWSQSSMPKPL